MKLRFPLQIIALVVFGVVSFFAIQQVLPNDGITLFIPAVIFAVVFVIAIAISIYFGEKKSHSDLGAFIGQSIGAFSLTGVLACSMFPNLVVASPDSIGYNITLMSAGASDLSLTYMTIILCIGLPLVLIYHVVIYRTFRGRVSSGDLGHADEIPEAAAA